VNSKRKRRVASKELVGKALDAVGIKRRNDGGATVFGSRAEAKEAVSEWIVADELRRRLEEEAKVVSFHETGRSVLDAVDQRSDHDRLVVVPGDEMFLLAAGDRFSEELREQISRVMAERESRRKVGSKGIKQRPGK